MIAGGLYVLRMFFPCFLFIADPTLRQVILAFLNSNGGKKCRCTTFSGLVDVRGH